MSEKPLRVIIVEDEMEIRDLLSLHLKGIGFEVLQLESGRDILTHIENFHPDVMLLDQLMPGKSGQEIIKEIRANMQFCNLPIMMVTGLSGEEQKVASLNIGADDYVTKPFSMKEVAARILALSRRAKVAYQENQQNIVVKDLIVDLSAHRVTLRGNDVQLTLTEFKILCELLKQSGQVLTRDRLREKALGNLNVTDRTIDVHMASLRKKLEEMGERIETVRGVGYRLAI